MIKNVVFDLGQVLIEWKPRNLLKNFTEKEEDLDLLEIICTSEEWEKLDEGTITKREVYENLAKKLPDRLKNICKEFIYHYAEYIVLNDDICEIAIKLKENGYNVYVLSNTDEADYWQLQERYIGKYIDGWLISAQEKMLKPNKEIYLRLFEKFNLNPEECFFIDDKEVNIIGGQKLGMNGHVLNREKYGTTKLLKDFEKYGIKINTKLK